MGSRVDGRQCWCSFSHHTILRYSRAKRAGERERREGRVVINSFFSCSSALQHSVQWLGLLNIVGGVIGGLLVGKMHDHYRHFKVLIGCFFLIAAGVYPLLLLFSSFH